MNNPYREATEREATRTMDNDRSETLTRTAAENRLIAFAHDLQTWRGLVERYGTEDDLRREMDEMRWLLGVRPVWRQGRKVGRTLYEQAGDRPSDGDQLIGLMDTPALAERVVAAVNAAGLADLPGDDVAACAACGCLCPCVCDCQECGCGD